MKIREWRDTEKREPKFDGLEDWPSRDILNALGEGQSIAIDAVKSASGALAQAVEAAALRLKNPDGRIIYVGAGTSGRLAILDGIELTPTFGWPPERCVFLFAGGMGGLQKAVEGAEDDTQAAIEDAKSANIGPNDVVLGLAASGTTPYTRKVIALARQQGALTIGIANNENAPLLGDADIGVFLQTGPEVLAGSTRLGAGTAQKAALNLFSTTLMARLNKIHRGYMIDVLTTNDKLVARAIAMITDLTGSSSQAAKDALELSNNHVKSAVLILAGCAPKETRDLLKAHDDHLAEALASIENSQN